MCEKNVHNKYGKVYQDFKEAFKYFKKAYEAGDPDGIAYYAFYLELPHGLFTPDPEESVRLTKIAADKGSAFGIHRDGVHHLNGICRPVNFEEGWRLIDIAVQKEVPDSYFFIGLANYYGSYGKTKSQEVGLNFHYRSIFKTLSLFTILILDKKKIRQKLKKKSLLKTNVRMVWLSSLL